MNSPSEDYRKWWADETAEGYQYLISRVTRETTLVHPPVTEMMAIRSILGDEEYDRRPLGALYPWGQYPFLVYFEDPENRAMWIRYFFKFGLGFHRFTLTWDWGNVLSKMSFEALRCLFDEVQEDDLYQAGVVSYVRAGSWSRCFEYESQRDFAGLCQFVVLVTERNPQPIIRVFYPDEVHSYGVPSQHLIVVDGS